MDRIKIWFVDFWGGFDVNNNYIANMLRPFNVIVTPDKPDVVFSTPVHRSHDYRRFFNSIKISVINSEQFFEFDSSSFDYCIGVCSSHDADRDRFFQLPFWLNRVFINPLSDNPYDYWNRYKSDDVLLNRGFCGFVGVLDGRIYRREFVTELDRYRKVDAAIGPYFSKKLPNDNGFVSKIEYLSHRKFTIAFENGNRPGYITEKIIDPIYAGSLPIYYGNIATLQKDFILDQELIVEGSDFKRVIDRIKYLDAHDSDYMGLMRSPILKPNRPEAYRQAFYDFITYTMVRGRVI